MAPAIDELVVSKEMQRGSKVPEVRTRQRTVSSPLPGRPSLAGGAPVRCSFLPNSQSPHHNP